MIKHGGDVWTNKIKIDFSANINPLGMPFEAQKALIEHIHDYEFYPDINCTALINAISEFENVGKENIVCGNGASDLIYRIVGALKPKKALLPAPSFSEYEKALSENGCLINWLYLKEKDNFNVNENIIDEIKDNDVLFLCNPNNPTGRVIKSNMILQIAKECKNTVLVIDECFMPFVKGGETAMLFENVIVLKAFTKIYAMAGLRLGYALCKSVEMAEKIHNYGPCWNVSVPAQIAGIKALEDKEYLTKTVDLISKERDFLTYELKKCGFKVYPSDTNFILFKSDRKLEDILTKKGIAIRNCGDFRGLDSTYYRIAVRTHKENVELIKALNGGNKNA